MKKAEMIQMLSGLGGGLVAFVLLLLFKFPLILTISLPIAVYFGVYFLSKPQIKIGGITLANANGEEMKALMEEGYKDLEVLKKGGKNLPNSRVRELSTDLYIRGVDIYKHLQGHPDKIPLARRFLTYYLDLASNLVEKYHQVTSSNVQGKSVEAMEEDVEEGMEILKKAFDKEYEHMMQGEIMDIELDVKVLEQGFKSEE